MRSISPQQGKAVLSSTLRDDTIFQKVYLVVEFSTQFGIWHIVS